MHNHDLTVIFSIFHSQKPILIALLYSLNVFQQSCTIRHCFRQLCYMFPPQRSIAGGQPFWIINPTTFTILSCLTQSISWLPLILKMFPLCLELICRIWCFYHKVQYSPLIWHLSAGLFHSLFWMSSIRFNVSWIAKLW